MKSIDVRWLDRLTALLTARLPEAETTHPQSFGLIGMKERVYPWKGEVRVRGIPGRGTTVTVTLPLAGKETGHDYNHRRR